MRAKNLAFTLVEMLTVIAISAVLLTIIVLPIFQSFNLTRAAEAFSNAQDLARSLTSKINDEISSAVSVRGTSGTVPSTLNRATAYLPSHSIVVQVYGKNGTTAEEVVLPWMKLDIIPPAQVGTKGPKGGFIDPITGKEDPTLKTFKGQTQTPTVPSNYLVRYSVGLRDPFSLYNDPYSGILQAQGGGRDNLYTLYRSVAAPYVFEPDPTSGQLVKTVNTALFDIDPNTKAVKYDDPRFLLPDRDNTGAIIQDAHTLHVYHWLGISPSWENSVTAVSAADHDPSNFAHTVIQTEVSRYDMIMPQYDLRTRKATYDGDVPRLTPLIQFKPTVVSNDPAAGQEALRPGEETDNAWAIAPDVYTTAYGLWNNAIIRTYPAGYSAGSSYDVSFVEAAGGTNTPPGFSIFSYNPANGGTEFTNSTEMFDDYWYDNAVSLLQSGTPVYPFTGALTQANSRSGWLGQSALHQTFTPFHVLAGTGKIIASFDISEVGYNALPSDPTQDPNRSNLPTQEIPNTPEPPGADSGIGATFSGSGYDINRAYNYAYNQHPVLQGNVQRFIDLRVTPNEDGTYPPLYPTAISGQATDFQMLLPNQSMMNRVRIVPGSEIVVGPDENPGDHYGHSIRYTRVTGVNAPVGPNQYRINYVDLNEPVDASGNVTATSYETAFGLSPSEISGFSVDAYDPANFVSATLQPRFKVGYIELNSDPNVPIPQGYANGASVAPVPFKIDYRFQFTGTLPASAVPAGTSRSDSFAVDYDTRQLMQVLLTIRNYPQSNLPNPQTVTLKATATIKNVTR